MIRRTARLGLVAAMLLGACTSEGPNDLGRVGRLALDSVIGAEPDPPQPLPTRAEINRTRPALIAINFPDQPPGLIAPVVKNGPYLTYADQSRRSLIIRGGALSGTRGQPFDLIAVRHSQDDPIAHPRPLWEWPTVVDREYQYTQRDQEPFSITLTCLYDRMGEEEIEIIERFYEVVRVRETCRNSTREVINTYWAVEETGFIWQSQQWAGPSIPPFVIRVVRPFRES